ncbi:hypothetical protein E0Z10_g5756 [Xylaria hypoxylon]|uniref:Uncharacterized protein n=1 Tax=Xylaria hypoxylon TaxID=37992 RepID=A0A4Z0YFU7_9PEZI|nr:hypothetical protein E0Z10_g5756 [Xylaria hypoxylon]
MRTVSLPRVKPPARTSEVPKSDIPSPLHIIKRTKTVEFRPSKKRETSSGSIDYGPDRPLSVMKKRQHRGPVVETTFKTSGLAPKPDCISPAQQQPKLRAPMRWFSRQRTSSSGTTYRSYGPRSCSISSNGSSIGRSPSSEFFDEALTLEPSGSHSSAQMDTSFSSMPTSADYSDDCHLLVPRISITPEVQTPNNAISTVWATIEISAQLSRPYTDGMLNPHPGDRFLLSNPLRAGSVSRFGSLYNLQVDVIPAPQTAVIEVVQDNQKRSLNLGSTMLILAKVQIDRRQRPHDRAMLQKSNELIADLESELGLASIRYLQVRLRYRHSGFPASNNAAPTYGIVDCQTQLETIAIGVIEQQDLYSPSGFPPLNIAKSSTFGLVASYWGPVRAHEIFCQKTSRQFNSMIAADNTLAGSRKIMTTEDPFTHRIAKDFNPFTTFPRSQVSIQTLPRDQGEDPARKIWTEMRRRTSRGRQNIRTRNTEDLSAVSALSISERAPINTGLMRMKSDVEHRRELIRDVALRNKRSIGADSLKSLVPSMMNLDICGKEAWGDSSSNTFNKENVPPERRKEGRWSLAGWW